MTKLRVSPSVDGTDRTNLRVNFRLSFTDLVTIIAYNAPVNPDDVLPEISGAEVMDKVRFTLKYDGLERTSYWTDDWTDEQQDRIVARAEAQVLKEWTA